MKLTTYKLLSIIMLLLLISSTGLTQNDTEIKANLQFENLQGNSVPLQNYMGKITVVNLWATWSASSIKVMPVLEQICQDYCAQNIKVVGIAVYSDQKKIGKILHLTKISYPVLIADKKQLKAFGNLSIIPQTFILDSNGTILEHFSGSQSYKALSSALNKILGNQTLTKNLY